MQVFEARRTSSSTIPHFTLLFPTYLSLHTHDTMTDNIFLFGLGGVGAVYAFILNEAPNAQVTVCGRSNFQAVRDQGLEIRSEKFGERKGYKFHHAVSTPSDASLKGTNFKYVVCANKAITMSPSASEQIAPIVGEDTTIVLIQNGVGNDEEFRKRFPGNTILSGVTWVNANQPSPGVIVHKFEETMQFGVHWNESIDRAKQQAAYDRFVAHLRGGGTDVEEVPSIDLWRWKKTIWNCTWNTLTALTFCNTAQYLDASSSARIVARAIIDEMATIARALGHDIDEEYLTSVLERDAVKTGIYSSMCMDAVNGRPMEVDVIVSGPLRKAKELGIKTPTLEVINALVSANDWRFRNGIPAPGR